MNVETTSHLSITRLLEDARRKLVETGTRNRLIHTSRKAARGNNLNIINERTEDVFDLLRVQKKRMRFLATGKDDEEDTEGLLLAFSELESDEFDPARYRDLFLESALGPEKLERRLLRLFTGARIAEEEQGFNILYLAMGFLKWFESSSSNNTREAPLILIPVQLVRNERRATFNLVARDDDIVTNLPLQERLRSDFGIELPEIEDSEDWRPETYLAEIEQIATSRQRWSVDVDGMQLGFFSFAKLLMLRDLDPKNWPSEAIEENSLIRGLLAEGFTEEDPLFAPEDRLDERLDPADIVHVVDADASQTKVIEEIRSGRNLVVQGPPGTGKSQTIANIIAGAVHDGKKVLFMAEKMAALRVVHDRLQKVGLSNICLELHSRTSNKRAFIQELKGTLSSGRAIPDMPDDPESLRRVRDRLNSIARLLHDPVPGYHFAPISPLSEISDFVGRQVFPSQLKGDNFVQITDEKRSKIVGYIEEYVELLSKFGARDRHPFFGTNAVDLQPTDLQRLELNLKETSSLLLAAQELIKQICDAAGIANPDTLEGREQSVRATFNVGQNAIRSRCDGRGSIPAYRTRANVRGACRRSGMAHRLERSR